MKIRRIVKTFYLWVMPAFFLAALFLIPFIGPRAGYINPIGNCLPFRIWIGITFCWWYVLSSDFYGFRSKVFFIGSTETIKGFSLLIYLIQGIGMVIVSPLVTRWIIIVFVPIMSEISWFLSLLHGLILAFPYLLHFKKPQEYI